ncbi:MAG TPA: hypothetical protein DCP92_21655 [Nitrospiraceae bacterium]|jgi:hypothetical protein|nr:hypothetical protein [Nitrospiraceae bacterium]
MLEDENISLKNKISELKERLNQIYSQSAIEASKSKAFESEFSLYLKACEHAQSERMEGIRLQQDATKFGLAVLTLVLTFAIYIFNIHILLGMLVLLGFGVISCGFMYLLLAGEIRIAKAREYCLELEAHFKRYRWSTQQNEALSLPVIPLWEEYGSKWERDLFAEGPYGKTATYAPFRISMTLTDLLAFVYLTYAYIAHRSELSWITMIIGCIAWVMAVTVQMLLVNTIINKVGRRLARGKETLEEYSKKGIDWQPDTWGNILRLFLALDIIFPKEIKKEKN